MSPKYVCAFINLGLKSVQGLFSINEIYCQAAAVRMELRGGEWKKAYMQMDGEPWKQPIDNELSTFVEISKVPHYSIMISGE